MTNTDSHQNATAEIRRLNDQLRTTFVGGAILITPGVESLTISQRSALLALIRSFEAFTAGDDPYGEHDFGAVDFEGSKFFFKIDYYDLVMEAGSPDPADPSCTRRVMTIMRADEY
ncbi:hypothetical protein CWB41_12175 [Methylovirgula ligni]|uniref:Uncharacterized protein DUF3768 n=1 Tax=Methylovirgula ligni TaxID=569860 RepID=A0A3D9YWD9_9HYPH|nr:DUF3768 domain-containing protein [Methylovirgula ligni]QAY96393.1 hypothetical protein CWB41_12175 [Methylovirgula ligni]REF85883.1 uncharacterized protein DUF3768 [Methylovirgula ligni]